MMALITWLGPVLELGILLGLIVRRRLGQVVMLPLLLVALIASATTVGLCPACNTWDFWLVKEFVHAALLLALGFEMAQRVFTDAPARRAARRWTAFVVMAMLALLVSGGREFLIVGILPRLIASIAWLYTGLAIVMLRYGVRTDPIHDAILSGFPPYLMLYAATWSQVTDSTRMAAFLNPLVLIGVLAALLHAAWRPPRARDVPWLLRRLRGRRTRQPSPPAQGGARVAVLAGTAA
jgi:hypothetical protein